MAPTTSISPTDSTTTSTVATNRLVRSDHRRFTSLPDGLVPGAANRADQLGLAELAPQLGDVDVDRSCAPGVRHAPDLVEQLVAADHDARVLEQHRQQVELLGRQLDGMPVDGDLTGVAVQDHVVERQHVLGAAPVGAPEYG